jgi:hypothetical protein
MHKKQEKSPPKEKSQQARRASYQHQRERRLPPQEQQPALCSRRKEFRQNKTKENAWSHFLGESISREASPSMCCVFSALARASLVAAATGRSDGRGSCGPYELRREGGEGRKSLVVWLRTLQLGESPPLIYTQARGRRLKRPTDGRGRADPAAGASTWPPLAMSHPPRYVCTYATTQAHLPPHIIHLVNLEGQTHEEGGKIWEKPTGRRCTSSG